MRWKRWVMTGFVAALLAVFCFAFYKGCYEQTNDRLQTVKKDTTLQEKAVGVNQSGQTVKKDAVCEFRYLDTATGKEWTESGQVEPEWIGLTRTELIDCLAKELSDMSLNEYQKGLVSSRLTSFSDEKLVVEKTYNSKAHPYEYYMIVYDNMLVVYYSDKKTVYEYTGIMVDDIPEKDQITLNHGMYIRDQEELYELLQSYSS